MVSVQYLNSLAAYWASLGEVRFTMGNGVNFPLRTVSISTVAATNAFGLDHAKPTHVVVLGSDSKDELVLLERDIDVHNIPTVDSFESLVRETRTPHKETSSEPVSLDDTLRDMLAVTKVMTLCTSRSGEDALPSFYYETTAHGNTVGYWNDNFIAAPAGMSRWGMREATRIYDIIRDNAPHYASYYDFFDDMLSGIGIKELAEATGSDVSQSPDVIGS